MNWEETFRENKITYIKKKEQLSIKELSYQWKIIKNFPLEKKIIWLWFCESLKCKSIKPEDVDYKLMEDLLNTL
jgi:hypothetical protein